MSLVRCKSPGCSSYDEMDGLCYCHAAFLYRDGRVGRRDGGLCETPTSYQTWTQTVDKHPTEPFGMLVMSWALALTSEAGEVAAKLDKLFRDQGPIPFEILTSPREVKNPLTQAQRDQWREMFSKELGDVAHCLARLAAVTGFSLQELLDENVKKIEDRKARGTLGGSGDVR